MPFRFFFLTLRRVTSHYQHCAKPNLHSPFVSLSQNKFHVLRGLPRASGALRSYSVTATEKEEFEFQSHPINDDLKNRIFRLRLPKRSATDALDKWIAEGKEITQPELRRIVKELCKSQRYKHALEISRWMEARDHFRMSSLDYSIRLDLIIHVDGLAHAEEYFENLPSSASKKASCLPLLHSFVKARDTARAEGLMSKLQDLGLTVSSHPYNEMMKLYMATGHFEKVPLVIRQMKYNVIPRNVLSYNLWMSACGAISSVLSVEKVYEEMKNDKQVKVGWSTLSTLANIYMKSGLDNKALVALQEAEQKLSTKNRLGYFFLITLYATLGHRDGVVRLWKASKRVVGRITCANYMCIISCFLKVGDIREAERVFMEWDSICVKYDARVSNVLLGAYMRKGWMEKAEALHFHTLSKGGRPNYKTWEILMEGWVRAKEMDKAVEAMKRGFSMLKDCEWRPPDPIVMAIAEYFEENSLVEDAKRYVKTLHRLGLASRPIYKSFLRVCVHAQGEASDVIKMMERDKIVFDEDTFGLVQCVSKKSGVEVS